MNGPMPSSGCQSGQFMVDRTPAYENNLKRKKGRRKNQVISQQGIIRPDLRQKAKYL